MAVPVFSAFLVCMFSCGVSFNLDISNPIVKTGNNNSYFGFSVTGHQVNHGNHTTEWVLVGAPLDKNWQPNTSSSGALWKCPITPIRNDCVQVVTDGIRNIGAESPQQLQPPFDFEVKEGQWLGVSVTSQGPGGSYFAICSHLYRKYYKNGSKFMMGYCYRFMGDFQFDGMTEPCTLGYHNANHNDFGFCQAGVSSNFLDDGHLVIGAPSSFSWRGAAFTQYMEEMASNSYTDVSVQPPVNLFSYMGMSVTGGNFFDNTIVYATGASRWGGTGGVLFYKEFQKKGAPETKLVYLKSESIKGEQVGSNFGYSLETGDFNGDGFLDLLVGAPFHFSKNTGGAVYLYLNKGDGFKKGAAARLVGSVFSEFGMSIANMGDINRDGCEDFAVGSPRQGAGVIYIYLGNRKTGVITTPVQIIKGEEMPVMLSSFGYALNGKHDLDGNNYRDLVVGAYETSHVVVLRTRPVLDIKTVFKMSNNLKNIDPTRKGCEGDPASPYTCFSIDACCIINSFVETEFKGNYKLQYVIEAEVGKKFSRVFFGPDLSRKDLSMIKKVIEVKKNKQFCTQHIVYLNENTRDLLNSINFQLNYTLVKDPPKYQRFGALQSLEDYPVLNSTSSTTFQAPFLNDCGEDEICHSDMRISLAMTLPKSEKDSDAYIVALGQYEEIKLEIWLENRNESAYDAHVYIKHHKDLNYIAANISDKTVLCGTHNETVVVCSLPNPLKRHEPKSNMITLRFDPLSLKDDELGLEFEVFANSTSVELFKKEPAVVRALIVKNAEVLLSGNGQPQQVFYGGPKKGESAMNYLDDIGARIVHVYQVYNKGPWHVQSIELEVKWPYQVASDTPEGKWLLYVESTPYIEAQNGGKCEVQEENINPLKLTRKPGTSEPAMNLKMPDDLFRGSDFEEEHFNRSGLRHRMNKRDIEEMRAEALVDKDGNRRPGASLSCENGTAKCIVFKCYIYRLQRNQGATVTITSRLWNSTLFEDYPGYGSVRIASTASLALPDYYNQNNLADDVNSVITVAYPDMITIEANSIPWWVIIVSVLAGLLVLIILILALWKLGFFKRSRPDPTLSGNLEKNNDEGSPFLVSS